MQPIRNQILVKPYPSDEVSSGGIIVPESFREVSNRVHIVSVGNGTKERPMRLKEGQTGHRVKSWGTEIVMNGELYFLMEDTAIIALNE